ncbi:MAG: NAD(P)-dependent oxidoreductase [Coriobacteriia bacterium]
MSGPWPKTPFAASIDLSGRPVAVIGGDAVALEAALALAACGARVRLVARDAPVLDGVESVPRGYVRGDLAGALLAVCSTDDAEVRAAVRAEAEECRCLLHAVGAPELSSFEPIGEGER